MQKLLDWLNDLAETLLPQGGPEPMPIPVRVDDGRHGGHRQGGHNAGGHPTRDPR